MKFFKEKTNLLQPLANTTSEVLFNFASTA